MAYGLSTRAPSADRAPAKAVAVDALHCTGRPWRALDEACRLALVERAINPANDRLDAFPLAL
jgi:hypothetical protein